MANNPSCSVPGDDCSEPGGRIKRGMCGKHYGRWLKSGDPLEVFAWPEITSCLHAGDGSDCSPPGGKFTRGMCGRHYQRWRTKGDPTSGRLRRDTTALCKYDGVDCNHPAGLRLVRGMCPKHYSRWRIHGDALYVPEDPGIAPCVHESADCSDSPIRSNGMCSTHYQRSRRKPKYGPPPPVDCRIPGCEEDRAHKGLCVKHYKKAQRDPGGDMYVRPKIPNGLTRAFIEKALTFTSDECLIWPYTRYPGGYGQLEWNGRTQSAHRLVMLLLTGGPPSPEMRFVAHAPIVCANRACINPRHLRWATPSENTLDQVPDGTFARAKLDVFEVREIRRDPRDAYVIALDHGVSEQCIRNVQDYKTWAWLPD